MANSIKKDTFQLVTEQIIASLEKGIVPWKKPWNVIPGMMPINVANKKPYNGLNILMLACQPYTSNVWGTFNQWKDKGGFVKKGEKSTTVIFWTFFEKKDTNGNLVLNAKGKPETVPYLRYYNVFNAEQIVGIDLEKYTPKQGKSSEFNPISEAEKVISQMPNCPKIKHSGNRAYYSPSLDYIGMPMPAQFHSNQEYYSTLFHELSHSTGHETRIGRDLSPTSFGSESYSKEELIAEISACFLCSTVGIEQTFDNSTAYIKGWLEKLKNDKKLIVYAASQAKKSADYILGNTKEETENIEQMETV